MNLDERYADKPTKMINIWAELLDGWRAVNKASTQLKIAENNYSIVKDRLFKLLGKNPPETVVLIDGEITYIVEIDLSSMRPKISDIRYAERRTLLAWEDTLNETS